MWMCGLKKKNSCIIVLHHHIIPICQNCSFRVVIVFLFSFRIADFVFISFEQFFGILKTFRPIKTYQQVCIPRYTTLLCPFQ